MEIVLGAVATSGIGKRTWVNDDGDAAHHLLDPATGAPAYTGVIQATAKAPTAFLAEVYAKHAILSGTEEAPGRLPYGGVILLEDGTVEAVCRLAAAPGDGRVNVGSHLFWITSRSAGEMALLLSSASVGLGLMMSSPRAICQQA